MTTSHGLTMNGRITTELRPRPGRTVEAELTARLGLLDGQDRFALLLCRLPEGVSFDRYDLKSGPSDYIQCAGGVAGRFTCEVRRTAPNGHSQHDVIGRARDAGPATACERIRWAENETMVRENEVLSLDEVNELFSEYLAHGTVAAGYERRTLEP